MLAQQKDAKAHEELQKDGAIDRHARSRPWHNSAAGFVANMVSQLLYPLENVKMRF
jgi:hypothetical protein